MKRDFTPEMTHSIKKRAGFTFVEVITVLLIIGIGISLFYNILYINWNSFEKQLSLIDLQMESDMLLENIAFDGKFSRLFTVAADRKSVMFTFPGGATVTYAFASTGNITRADSASGTVSTLAHNIDYTNSSFASLGNYFNTTLVAVGDALGRRVDLSVVTQIMPRNP